MGSGERDPLLIKAVPRCDSGDTRGQHRQWPLDPELGQGGQQLRLGSQVHGELWRAAFDSLLSFIPVFFPEGLPWELQVV